MILFRDAVQTALLADDAPAVTDYEIYKIAKAIFEAGQWDGVRVKKAPADWAPARTRSIVGRLNDISAIVPDQDFQSGVWRIVQSTRAGLAEEVACIADPFCYVSHLSAMQRYGLTNRTPGALHLTKPSRDVWTKMRAERLASEVPKQDVRDALKLFRISGFNPQIRRRDVIVHETKYPVEPSAVRGQRTRISPIGHTFVEMLAEPHLCGGIPHALDIWDDKAADWIDDIIKYVDLSASKIAKVRAGYILTERLGVSRPEIEGWRVHAQRGGSRKLDPDAPYEPTFSEAWMISLNV